MAGYPLNDPDLRRLRALKMIEARIRGKGLDEVAREFNVSRDTVRRTLSWAKKAELVVEAEDKILQELIPAAHKAVARALQSSDDELAAKTALEIFKGTLPSFTKGGAKKQIEVSTGGNEDLASYIASLRGGHGVIEGTVVGPQGALPAGPESVAPEGDAAPGHGNAVGETSQPQGAPSLGDIEREGTSGDAST